MTSVFMRISFWVFLVSVLISFSGFGRQPENHTDLQVGYIGSAPFIFTENNHQEGIVIDIWKSIASGLEVSSNYHFFASVDEGIEAIENKEIDILIGPITINSMRMKQADFSQPYYNTELGILAPKIESTVWDRIQPFFSTTLLYIGAGLLLVLILIGFLFWVVEGRKSEEHGKGILKGTGSGIWLAIVTM